jgi:hypothetical protein
VGKITKTSPEEKARIQANLDRLYRLLDERVKEDERIRAAKAAREQTER